MVDVDVGRLRARFCSIGIVTPIFRLRMSANAITRLTQCNWRLGQAFRWAAKLLSELAWDVMIMGRLIL
ncbi:hypothetical protein CHN51_18880 (plasmid) [Sphingorhabdus sp. YGSMI21]|nr:hypothetical protein CHN51_18880 [Sphingorhabdus sp. YGSMI21]